MSTIPSVSEFLKTTSLSEGATLTLGNPAGDADSIVSAIALAYIDSTQTNNPTIPIVSIPHEDLKTQRPETKYLLQLAGIDLDDLIAVDHSSLPNQASVLLVDHNQLTLNDKSEWKVTQILDHHLDEGAHTDTCSSLEHRNIAFDSASSKALVASTCTLLVERFLANNNKDETSFPPSLSILLMGVILLDSINMLPQAGKATPRDHAALQALQTQTDWTLLKSLPTEVLGDGTVSVASNPKNLFDTLQNQKFSAEFWDSLTSLQALKLDYKSFSIPSLATSSFGVATVLQNRQDFLKKPQLLEAIVSPTFEGLEFFGIMYFAVENETPVRSMTLASPNCDLLEGLVAFLEQEGSLQVEKAGKITSDDENTKLYSVHLNQGNAKASRKQVVPILMEYFKQQETNAKL